MREINYLFLFLILSSTFLASCSKDDDVGNDIVAEDFTITIEENPENGRTLGVINASVNGGSVSFAIISQEPTNAMTIDIVTGELSVNDASLFDFEKYPVLKASIEVSAEGAEKKRINATITLRNLEENVRGFITTWQTSEDNESITIPINSQAFQYKYTVNWGDGNIEEGITGNATHTFARAGVQTIEITGDFPAIYFYDHEDAPKILSIEQWGDIKWKSMANAFASCENLNLNATDAPDLSQVTEMISMFMDAYALNADLNDWDVSNVTNMRAVFYNRNSEKKMSFNGDLSDWDVSNVWDMSYMFYYSESFNGDLNQWNVEKVTNMASMFEGASAFNQNLNDWDVGKVTNMYSMFRAASAFNQDLNKWDVSQVKDMSKMFAEASSFNGDISNWNVANVETMTYMFNLAIALNGNLSDWNVNKVRTMAGMFSGASTFNSDLSGWNVSQVQDMTSMFRNAASFNSDLNKWDVSNVRYMGTLFSGATSFNSELNAWDVSSVTNMKELFYQATSFNANLSNWNISKVTIMHFIFHRSAISIGNYEAILKGWSQLPTVMSGVGLGAQSLKYCATAEAARDILIAKGWSIYDLKATEEECL